MAPTLQIVQVTLQALTSFAIAGGLIYTAVQFRQARKAQDVANFSKLVELQMHLREMRVNDPSLAHIYKDDVADLHSDREIREYFMNLMQLSIFEIVWYAHREGQLSDDYFDSWVKRIKDIKTEDSFKKMFGNKAMKILHDDFQDYVASLVREPDQPRGRTLAVEAAPPSGDRR